MITSGGRLVGTRGGVVGTAVGMVVGRVVGVDGVFGSAVPPSFGSFVPALALASGGVTTTGGGGGGGFFVAGFHAVVVWQSAHVVGNVEWPGIRARVVLRAMTRRRTSFGVPAKTWAAFPGDSTKHFAFSCAPVSAQHGDEAPSDASHPRSDTRRTSSA